MNGLLLLLRHYSFLPLPQSRDESQAELPAALCLLPMWGLAAGLLCWALARLTWFMSVHWAAALLLGINILLNGGVWLRDVMLLAEGRRPLVVTDAAGPPLPAPRPDTPPGQPVVFSRRALLAGGLYLLGYYLCLLALLRTPLLPFAYVAAAVCCRWIYVWGVYDFAALRPAFLHLGLDKQHFIRASLCALPVLAVCAAMESSIMPALLAAVLLGWLLFRMRARFLGALDEAAYGAVAAAAEIFFFVVYVLL